MSESLIGKPTNNESRYLREHAARNRKVLVGKPEVLLEANIQAIRTHCMQNLKTPEALIVLTSICTGWGVKDLLDKRPVHKSVYGEVSLTSPWRLTTPKLASPCKELLIKTDDVGLIPLPVCLGDPLYDALTNIPPDELSEASVKAFLKTIPREMGQQLTFTRIRKVIAYYRKRFGITDHMQSFVSGESLDDCSQGYYIAFGYELLKDSLGRYWEWLLNDLFPLSATQDERFFGSKLALSRDGTKRIFDWHRCQIEQAISQHEHKHAFNAVTLYVIDLLQFVTLCRRVNADFGSLESFTSDFQCLYVKDKGGKSARLLPVPKDVSLVVQNYLFFLRSLKLECKFIHKEVSATIQQILNGERPLFHLWMSKNQLRPATTKRIEFLTDKFPLHRNWHRHTVLTALYGKKVCADKLRCFSDHQPSLDHWFSKFSSSSFETLYEVSRHIEELIQEWNIPLLQPQWY